MEHIRYIVPIVLILIYAAINEFVGKKYGEFSAFITFCIFLLISYLFIFYYW